jgi:hypothetical protein
MRPYKPCASSPRPAAKKSTFWWCDRDYLESFDEIRANLPKPVLGMAEGGSARMLLHSFALTLPKDVQDSELACRRMHASSVIRK